MTGEPLTPSDAEPEPDPEPEPASGPECGGELGERRLIEPDNVAQLLSAAAPHLYLQPDVESTVNAVVHQGVEVIGGDAAGATLLRPRGRREVAAATTDRAEEADRVQFELSEGPSLTALTEQVPILVTDSTTEPRWPRWTAVIAEIGYRSMLAMPLDLGPHYSGTVIVFWELAEQPAERHVAVAKLLLRHAAIAITDARRSSTLREAIDARYQIGLAQGILMERYGLDATQSFEVLRRYSRDNNVKLSRVAGDVVRTRSLPDAYNTGE
ncbi:GAF and ANTAR domain-containing protein [Jiangella mangrovi]|uniref:ANTAR domain-containing protein n=1 Tax=Jiangella mangrovi TaxID=1524084 RepID=A0A7W9GQ80_9ACTN|nr:GAF and ANTAR domain-containing protein [Jiangella mangrovi]MBB5787824.1 hypothetical protein [Jiangella mangrovi]